MSDVNKYINAYIDTCVNTINDLNIKYIQTQAQAKVASDLVKERDDTIASLMAELENSRNSNTEKQKQVENAKVWEDSYNAMKNKLSHMDTLMSQMGQMKIEIQSKNEEIQRLQTQIIELTTSKPSKRKKEIRVEELEPILEQAITETTNDF